MVADLASQGFRLPSADEWEYACAAGSRTLFHWGDHVPCDWYPVDPARQLPVEPDWAGILRQSRAFPRWAPGRRRAVFFSRSRRWPRRSVSSHKSALRQSTAVEFSKDSVSMDQFSFGQVTKRSGVCEPGPGPAATVASGRPRKCFPDLFFAQILGPGDGVAQAAGKELSVLQNHSELAA
ncbi:MAG: hypothetical protein KF760_23880 [Candidatus Eremiobacteraeota bacterium]|nr:hypothetical protein [Candidatus Eremiobacteraeota bacterium]MCW5866607.1 hypothetical protein [Candidatus Eremiobacteraeota bacterium]